MVHRGSAKFQRHGNWRSDVDQALSGAAESRVKPTFDPLKSLKRARIAKEKKDGQERRGVD